MRMASRPLSAETITMSCSSRTRRQCENVAHVVVDDQHLAAGEDLSDWCRSTQHLRCGSGSLATGRVQEERREVEQHVERVSPRTVTRSAARFHGRPSSISSSPIDDDRQRRVSPQLPLVQFAKTFVEVGRSG